jgi:predicted AAA+ superfamily ATPase
VYDFTMDENNWQEKWSGEQVQFMLREQFASFWQRDTGTTRAQLATVKRSSGSPHAVIISGLRRVGKSTLLAQLAHTLGEETFYYVNFEDERFLGFQSANANDLFAALVRTFGERKIFLIDEIQNIDGWEHFVRRFMDMGYKFYITGSNASLLSRELGTRLTGRHLSIELFPFSFSEFLSFQGQTTSDPRQWTTVERAGMQSRLDDYLRLGGIPDALKYPELPLLRNLYDDVLYRDIATRYRLDDVATLKELAFYLISNPAAPLSFNKLKDQFRLGSVNTITRYIDYLADSWLLFTLRQYAFSVKRQQIAPKKIYPIDTGMAQAVGFQFSPNTGKFLESAVFLALRRQTENIFYFATPGGFEVDFYLPEQRQLVQVAQHLDNPTTRQREIRALQDAIQSIPVQSALILTEANEEDFALDSVSVTVRSVAEWMTAGGR